MVEIKTFSFPSQADGLNIVGMAAIPDTSFVGIIQMVHGMAEHKERYEEVMKFLASKGYLCILHDHRGHGGSVLHEDDLGYFYDSTAQYLIEDIHQLTLSIKKEYPRLPIILFGHSMGSLLVRAYCKRYDQDVDALIVCGSPSKNIAAKAGRTLVKMMEKIKGERYRSSFVQRLAFGSNNAKFSEKNSDNVWLCSDAKVVHAYDEDPLCGFVFTLNGFENLFTLMIDVYDKKGWKLHHSHMPILFIAGSDDPCIVNEKEFKKAYEFMKERGYHHVDAKLYQGKRHEILNEIGKEEIYEDIFQWLLQNNMKGNDVNI